MVDGEGKACTDGDIRMKPAWKDAPEWAEWLAMDADGTWSWFASLPFILDGEWMPAPKTLCRTAKEPDLDWRDTLQVRPE